MLKELAFDYIPRSVLDRPKKGFSVPLEKWFREELREYVVDTLSMNRLRSIPGINADESRQMVLDHVSGKASKQNEIFKLITYVGWVDTWGKRRVTGPQSISN